MTSAVDVIELRASTVTPRGARPIYRTPTTTPHDEQEEARLARGSTDKDVEIGGADLAAQAIELGLVDELRMFRNPVVVGGGTPFLPPVTDEIALGLVETRTFGSRVIYERYRQTRDEPDRDRTSV